MFCWRCRETYGLKPRVIIGKAHISNNRKFGYRTLLERMKLEFICKMEFINDRFPYMRICRR